MRQRFTFDMKWIDLTGLNLNPQLMEPKALIENAVAAWQAGDDNAFWNLLADDVRYEVIGTTPASGVYQSKNEFFRNALIPMGKLLAQGARPVAYDMITEGNRVVFMWTGEGVMQNGNPYNNSYCWVIEVAGNRISKLKAYLDTALVDNLFNQS